MPTMSMVQALNSAMDVMLGRDPNVLIFGEDVGFYGGVFRVTEGLSETFGEKRCFDTPLAESALIGIAVGLAGWLAMAHYSGAELKSSAAGFPDYLRAKFALYRR